MSKQEPNFKKATCVYCGDAPVPHAVFYFESLVSNALDNQIKRVAKRAPNFLKAFAEWLPFFVFRTFAFLGLAHFSNDIDKAKTFRSRVIWEEAKRRGIHMEQIVLFGKPLDYYRARLLNGKTIYFESIPLPSTDLRDNWDDKFILKEELSKVGIPTPSYVKLPSSVRKTEEIFTTFKKPVIVKPKVGSRGRHTLTNISDFAELKKAIKVAGQLSPYLIMEEHLEGYVCRATVVEGKLMGFYRGEAPYVIGNGTETIRQLINKKNKTRPDRVEEVQIGSELLAHIARAGYKINDVLPDGVSLKVTHRVGRLFGGHTREMLDELHPSFVPVLQNAAKVLDITLAGFDLIAPNPEQDQSSQRWGIIECNTLPFIDLHYYALEGKPKNIAGAIWDMWK